MEQLDRVEFLEKLVQELRAENEQLVKSHEEERRGWVRLCAACGGERKPPLGEDLTPNKGMES